MGIMEASILKIKREKEFHSEQYTSSQSFFLPREELIGEAKII